MNKEEKCQSIFRLRPLSSGNVFDIITVGMLPKYLCGQEGTF